VHLSEDQIQRLLHGELSPREEESVRGHMTVCVQCRVRLAEADREEREINTLLRAVDSPTPRMDARTLIARAEASSRAAVVRSAWLRRAASVLIAITIAGAAYALPGSPLRRWVEAVVERMGVAPQRHGPEAGSGRPSAPGAGLSVLPGQKLVILFQTGRGGGQALVSLRDDPEVEIQGPPGAASYASGAGRIVVDVRDTPAPFEVHIPRSAPHVEILVNGERIFTKDSDRVTTGGPATGAGEYLLRLPPP